MTNSNLSFRRLLSRALIVVFILFSLCACVPDETVPPRLATNTPDQRTIIAAYFTDPEGIYADQAKGGLDEILVADIYAAKESVDVCMFNLGLPSITDALINAQKRGLFVRVVGESDKLDGSGFQDLVEAGIKVRGDNRDGLMHNKFIVIDGLVVWTGSLNLTTSSTYADNNDMVRVQSTKVAQNYVTEFDEMFNDKIFGPPGEENTPNPLVTFDGMDIEVLFSPDDRVARRIVELIDDADTSVHFMAYSLTSDSIAEALAERADDGVEVLGVMDDTQIESNTGGDYDWLREQGIDVRRDGNHSGLMHHKVIIIDGETVIFGSYNFTSSAEKYNDENVMIVHDRGLAASFEAEFEQLYPAGRP